MLAGSQDNGTQKFTTAGVNATTTVTGGDGAFCFIDQTDANIQISSYVYNSFYRSTNGGNNFLSIQSDQSTGSFINPADYDDFFNVLYSARTSSTLNRIRNVETTPSIDFINIAGMSSMATHVRTSPYASGSSTIFVGTGAGDLFKVTNANGISPSSTSLGSSLSAGSISCVELGANENELLVTFSNYGVNSIWYSTNGGATWVSKEGNLPDMPVRWALFNPLNRAEVLLATEVGVWSTQNFNSTSPTWTPSNSGLSHVRVDMLQIRDSDKMVMAITHGRGVFTSDGFNTSGPIADFGASSTSPCIGQSVQFTDLTQGNPTGWSWSFSPNTISFTNGTSSSSQNPQVSFSQAGTYQVALVSTNSFGTDSEVKSGYIVVGSSVIPSVSIATNSSTLCSGAPAVFTASPVNGGTAPTYQWKVNGVNVGTNAATYSSSTLANGDLVSVELTSNALCAASNTAVSNSIAVSVTQSVTPTVAITASTTTICAGSSVVFTANALNGGSAPLYQWKINGSNVLGSSSVFSTSTLSSNDVVTVELASSFTCVTSSTALSNGIAVTVNPQVVPSVAISASANSGCAGAPIVFTASPVNGGTAPSYQWKVNGVNVGTNSAVYGSSTLNNNDVVMVDMTSTAGCVSSASVLSSPLVVAITQPAAPGVGIQASSTSICVGEQVQFTALPTNGGTNPIYTWKVNGVNTGVSSNMFSTSSLNNNDLVSAEMASSLTCITAALVSSNVVPMTVNAFLSAQITNQVVNVLCSEDALYLDGVPSGGVFSSTSSGLIGQVFIPLLASNGSHWIKYTITGAGGCVGVDSLEVEVENIPVPTVSVSGDSVLTCNETGYLYQWYSQSGLITGATGQSHTVTSNGSYHVEISTQHCSSSSDSVLVNTIGTESVPGLSIDAYPNPASNWLVITAISGSSKSISMVLYNSVGQMVWVKDWSISQGLNEKMIDLSSFATGVYQLRVTDESKEVVRRIEVL
jgi:PKD repeat protein